MCAGLRPIAAGARPGGHAHWRPGSADRCASRRSWPDRRHQQSPRVPPRAGLAGRELAGLEGAMKYKLLGRTGVQVSQLCFGTMSFGGDADEPTSVAMYKAVRDAGINFFDT